MDQQQWALVVQNGSFSVFKVESGQLVYPLSSGVSLEETLRSASYQTSQRLVIPIAVVP